MKIGSHTLWSQVPTSHLLFMEKELAGPHSIVKDVQDVHEGWSC